MISIQTNVNSLVAQQNLSVNTAFQSKTIQQLTSGYRINQAGDDAAGLAVANKFRSTVAELSQGVANGNDATAQLQIMDSGMSNIGVMLDRLKTLATSSASGAFTGVRKTLNDEFQNDIAEIDRQAQSIGLDTGGTFAKNLNVYLGQGSGSSSLTNATVGVDLTNATVDSQSLGMKGMRAVAGTADLSGTSKTSVALLVADSTNKSTTATPGSADFYFNGAGFSDANKVKVSVNLSGVTDTASLVVAFNKAIAASGSGTTQAGSAFAKANIVASVNSTAVGTGTTEQLSFTSSTSAFQVQAGDQMANALLGNLVGDTTTGKDIKVAVTGAATASGGATFSPATSAATVRIQGGGLSTAVDLQLVSGAGHDALVSDAVTDLKTQITSNSALKAAGISVSGGTNGSALVFTSARGESFSVMATGDTKNQLGLGSFVTNTSAGGKVDYNSITGAAGTYVTSALKNQSNMQISVNGAAATNVAIDLTAGDAVASKVSTSVISNPNIDATNNTYSFSVDGVAVSGTLTAANEHASVAGSNVIANPTTITAGAKSKVTSTSILATHNFSAANADEQFTVTLGAGNAQTVSITANYTNGAGDAALLTQINSQLTGVTATIDGSNKLVFEANNKGAGTVVVAGTTANTGGAWTTTTANAAANSKVMISVDGGAAKEVDLTGVAGADLTLDHTGNGQTAITTMQGALDASFGANKVTVGMDASFHMTLTSATTNVGATSQISVFDIPTGLDTQNSGLAALFGSARSTTGTETTAAGIASQIQAQIDTATGTAGGTAGDLHATVKVNNDNSLTITNDNKGAVHTMTAISGNATAVLGSNAASLGTNRSGSDIKDSLNQTFATDSSLKPAQLKASWDGSSLVINSDNNTNFRVNSGTTDAATMTGSANISGGLNFSGAGTNPLGSKTFKVSTDGGATYSATITLSTDLTSGATATAKAQSVVDAINTALSGAGVTATASLVTTDATHSYLKMTSNSNGATSQIQVKAAANPITDSALTTFGLTTNNQTADGDLGFGVSGSSFTAAALTSAGTSANLSASTPKNFVVDSGGASSAYVTANDGTKNALAFGALKFGNDAQTITISGNDGGGNQQSKTITLKNIDTGVDATTNRSGRTIDDAVSYINTQLQATNNATLQKVVAVKEVGSDGSDQINFISPLSSFNVSVANTANAGDGVASGTATNVKTAVVGAGSNISIETQDGARAAVTALGAAVAKLGTAQAAIGRGENQLTYAISLATSQITNFSAAESQIRDTNVAQQAANLSKAQVLSQAGIAAMAQANSAPQAVLSLLRG